MTLVSTARVAQSSAFDGPFHVLQRDRPDAHRALEAVQQELVQRQLAALQHGRLGLEGDELHPRAQQGPQGGQRRDDEKCISYRSISADRAVKTRQKNQEAEAAGDGTEAEGPTGPTDPADPTDDGGDGEGVSRIPSPPPDMIFNIDLIAWKGVLKDLPAGATRGMRRAQPEFDAMAQEIVDNQTEYGDRGGITTTDFDQRPAISPEEESSQGGGEAGRPEQIFFSPPRLPASL